MTYLTDLAERAPVELLRFVVDRIARGAEIECGDGADDGPEDVLFITTGDDESWDRYIVGPAATLEEMGCAEEDDGHESGPGRGFCNGSNLRVYGTWAVWSRSGGLDI